MQEEMEDGGYLVTEKTTSFSTYKKSPKMSRKKLQIVMSPSSTFLATKAKRARRRRRKAAVRVSRQQVRRGKQQVLGLKIN